MPWRRAGVKHHPNEIYIDIVEEIDAIVDVSGNIISFDVAGSVEVQSNLSGIPDLLLTFKDPGIINDCSFHPCVRYSRYEMDKVVSFVPPDGAFQLMRYRIKPSALHVGFSPPIQCHVQASYGKSALTRSINRTENGVNQKGNISISVKARSISTLTYVGTRKGVTTTMEEVSVIIPFPKAVKTANLNANIGTVVYDEAGKIARWEIGNLDEKRNPQLNGTITLDCNARTVEQDPPLSVTWKLPLASFSGLTVGGLSVTGESYKPYKGVRNIAKSGRFFVRY